MTAQKMTCRTVTHLHLSATFRLIENLGYQKNIINIFTWINFARSILDRLLLKIIFTILCKYLLRIDPIDPVNLYLYFRVGYAPTCMIYKWAK